MNNLDHDPIILTGRSPISIIQQLPCVAQFVAPSGENLPESNTTSMEMEYSDSHSNIPTGDAIIDIGCTVSSSIATKRIAEFHFYQKKLKLIYTLALVVMFPALTQVAQLKFQNKSPFESHMLFASMGVVAYVVAIVASVTFFAMGDYLESLNKESSSGICYIYVILRCVFCFSVILAPLAFVLMLLVSDGYYWIGYSIICALFAVIVTCNVTDYIKLR
ncbi:hypothetical protein Tco_0038714 [Tanacetum coccineum]